MGVPQFFGIYILGIDGLVSAAPPDDVASLSIDLNGSIYAALDRIKPKDEKVLKAMRIDPIEIENKIHYELGNIIIEAIKLYRPTKVLTLAVDGIPPAAKMQHQKGRRARSHKDLFFDTNSITTGTDFMMRTHNFILTFISNNRTLLPPTVYYSPHLEQGEGEHKIFEIFRTKPFEPEDNHIVYGLDADLIILSSLCPLKNIYISREGNQVVNVDEVRQHHIEKLNTTTTPVEDFVVLTFFLGNDFVPRHPAINNIGQFFNTLLNYHEGQSLIDHDDVINWKSLAKVVEKLANEEINLLVESYKNPTKFPNTYLNRSVINGSFYYETFRDLWYQGAVGYKSEAMLEGYEPVREDKIRQMCRDFLYTLQWNYTYYSKGHLSMNMDWIYPWYRAPLWSDLYKVISEPDFNIKGFRATDTMFPFTALHQLVSVIPPGSQELVPIELRFLYESNSPLIDTYPVSFISELDGSNVEHDPLSFIPIINKAKVRMAVQMANFTVDRARNYLPMTLITSVYNTIGYMDFLRSLGPRIIPPREEFDSRRGRGGMRGGRGRGRGAFNPAPPRRTPPPRIEETTTSTPTKSIRRAPPTTPKFEPTTVQTSTSIRRKPGAVVVQPEIEGIKSPPKLILPGEGLPSFDSEIEIQVPEPRFIKSELIVDNDNDEWDKEAPLL